MFITFKNKQNEVVKVSTQNIKEIKYKDSSFVQIIYIDGTEINISYNANSFSFTTHHEVDINELNSVITEVLLIT